MWRARAPLSFADGAAEAAVFAAAMEATISGATVDASEDDCTDLSRRRNLLQAGSAELDFTVTVSGADAATATADSITSVVSAAVSDGSFATALTTAAAEQGVTDFVTPTVSGAVAVFAPTPVPTPAPTAATGTAPTTPTTPTTPTAPAPTASPVVAAPTASPVASVVLESGSWRVAPGVGLLGTCIAALATAWV